MTPEEFTSVFPDERACLRYLEHHRWPDGFVCQKCGWRGEPYRLATRPGQLGCRACRQWTNIRTGVLPRRMHLPVEKFFQAAYVVTQRVGGVSALQLQKELDIGNYETALNLLWTIQKRLGSVSLAKVGQSGGVVAVGLFALGGHDRQDGQGKTKRMRVLAGVESASTAASEKVPGRVFLQQVEWSASSEDIVWYLDGNVCEGAQVVVSSGMLAATRAFWARANVKQIPPHDLEEFKEIQWLFALLHALRKWLIDTYHWVSPEKLQGHLSEFALRSNRRFYTYSGFHLALGLPETLCECPHSWDLSEEVTRWQGV